MHFQGERCLQCMFAEIRYFEGPNKRDLLCCMWLRFGGSGEKEDCVPCDFGSIMCHDCCIGDTQISCALKGMVSVVRLHRKWSPEI